jgi:hypothetical protein
MRAALGEILLIRGAGPLWPSSFSRLSVGVYPFLNRLEKWEQHQRVLNTGGSRPVVSSVVQVGYESHFCINGSLPWARPVV